jgi:hypothetical protein
MNADRHHTSGQPPAESPPTRLDQFAFLEQILSFHQQMLRGTIVADELMRTGIRTLRRQMDFAGTFQQNLDHFGKQNSDFLQSMTAATAADWQRTADLASTETKDERRPSAH